MPNDQAHLNLLNHALQLCEKKEIEQAYKRADQFFKRGYIEEAIQIYQKIITTNPQTKYQIQGLGNKQMAQSYYQWFIYQWYSSLKQNQKIKGSPYDALSLCYLTIDGNPSYENQRKKGLKWFKMMVQIYPTNVGILIGYGNILNLHGIYDEALKIYSNVLQITPNFINAYVCKAFIHEYKRVDKTKSQQLANKVLQLNPNNQYGLFIKARNIAEVDQKIETLKAASLICPEYSRIMNQVGICYGGTKKLYSEAIEWYKKCVQSTPKYYSAYNNIGVNNQLLKNYDQAKIWYYKAAQILSTYQAPYDNLKNVYQQTKFTRINIQNQVKYESKTEKVPFFLKSWKSLLYQKLTRLSNILAIKSYPIKPERSLNLQFVRNIM